MKSMSERTDTSPPHSNLECAWRRRRWTLTIVRTVAAIFLAISVYAFISATIIAQPWDGGLEGYIVYFDEGFSYTARAFGCFILGGVLGIWNKPIARWLTPAYPERGPVCPNCEHGLSAEIPDRCPECGAQLS